MLSALFWCPEYLFVCGVFNVKFFWQLFPVFFAEFSIIYQNWYLTRRAKSSDYSLDHLKTIRLNFLRLSHLNMHFFQEVAGINCEINFQSLSFYNKRNTTSVWTDFLAWKDEYLLRIHTKISMSFSFQFFLVFLFLSILNKNNILLLNAFLAQFQNLFRTFRKKGLFIRISNDLFFEETDLLYRKVGNE